MDDIEMALEQSETVAVFVGPSGVSPWHNEEMRAALDEVVRTRDELRGRLQALADQLNRYAGIRAKLDRLNVLRTQLPKGQEKDSGTKSQDLERELNALKPDADARYQALEGKVDTALAELNQVLSEAGKAKAVTDVVCSWGVPGAK